jgi:hypothetical protein
MPDLSESDKTNAGIDVPEGRLKACGFLRIDVEITFAPVDSTLFGRSTGIFSTHRFIHRPRPAQALV